MESTKIGGYDVFFPFKPYALQKAYMSQVLKCLREKQNGLLESPTGTGKTLSLLCSTLSWLEKMKISPLLKVMDTKPKMINLDESGDPFDLAEEYAKDSKKDEKKAPANENPSPKIFYSSRTHAQLSQACKEMKRSYYRHMSAVVMGGRDNLCINEEVMRLESNTAKTHACRAKVKAKQCQYHIQYERKVLTSDDFNSTPILDIEDLVKLGMKHKVCPYYATRVVKQKADVIFMPYNYLLEPSSRKALGIEIQGNVIIFDEGHNIERICEDAVSGQLKSESIEFLIKELKTLAHHMRNINYVDNINPEALDALADLSLDEVTLLKDTLIALQGEIEKAVEGTEDKKVHIQKWVFDVCERVGITFGQHKLLMSAIENIMTYVINTSLMAGHSNFASFAAHLQLFNDFLLILFPDGFNDEKSWLEFQTEFIKKYRVFTEKENEENNEKKTNGFSQANGSSQTNGYSQSNKRFKGWNMVNNNKSPLEQKKPWTLFLWCLSASIGLNGLIRQGAHCLLITSGTLAPLHSFQIELETPFPVTLQNRHIIDESQIGIYIIKSSYNGITFNTCYDNRQNLEHIRAVGQSIVHFCKIIPDGVLLFFASYAVMTNMLKVWREKDKDWKIYSTLRSTKVLFEEPRDKVEFASCIEQFKQKIDEPNSKGAIFMGVCRGKLSEGLDMADKYCRGVIMIGLPFPATQEPRILVKKQYLTELRNPELTANDWYTLQMKRALNQAIGRIVRHKDDYGVVLLIDTRFEQHITGLSKWTQPFVKTKTYSEASNAVTRFFERHEAKFKNEIILK